MSLQDFWVEPPSRQLELEPHRSQEQKGMDTEVWDHRDKIKAIPEAPRDTVGQRLGVRPGTQTASILAFDASCL